MSTNQGGLRGPFGDSCSTYALFWIILAVIGFWPTIVGHGAAGWIGVALWWMLVITVFAVLAVVGQKKEAASPEHQDAQEATRRNLEEERRVQGAMSSYIAEFRSRGYTAEAAEAVARKRVREEVPPLRVWHASDIAAERQEADRRRRIRVGVLASCPRCRNLAPASQGVILAHLTASGQPCEGEGTITSDRRSASP